MPQNDNVRDFMIQLGSFYEIIEEPSPVKDAVKKNEISIGGSTGTTPEQSSSEISEHDEEDFNHSRIVDSIIKERGEQHYKETNNNERLETDNLAYPINLENSSHGEQKDTSLQEKEVDSFSRTYPPGSGGGGGRDQGAPPQGPRYGGIDEQIAIAVIRLQQDMSAVLERLGNLETQTRQNQSKDQKKKSTVWTQQTKVEDIVGTDNTDNNIPCDETFVVVVEL
ncbi:hypothetical protein KUTeg_015355 [Tegillarca granosa]|uniref:Uncharacterized protein n=1 Tax=Tegillarca granosa TaxID=220873 RepID=A0ABQ9ETI5_TEGGR|nr:hypothetical protein KUTeg_015355 [Tegillarca granosa]